MPRLIAVLSLCALVAVPRGADASPIVVSIDTSPIAGTAAQIAFDFVNGGAPSNSVVITNFVTNGSLGARSSTGGVTGTLPGVVTLSDSAFFNELLTSITLGTSLSFVFNPTSNGGPIPDEFSMFLLNAAGDASLFQTSDPSGGDALLAFDIRAGGGTLSTFGAVQGEVTVAASAVPEPSSWILLTLGLGAAGMGRRRLRMNRRHVTV